MGFLVLCCPNLISGEYHRLTDYLTEWTAAESVSDVLGTIEAEELGLEANIVAEAVEMGLASTTVVAKTQDNTPIGIDITALVDAIVDQLPGEKLANARTKFILRTILVYILLRAFEAALGGIGEVEYQRWRNVDDESEQVNRALQEERVAALQLEELQSIRRLLEHPPHLARLNKRAHIRQAAGRNSLSLTVLDVNSDVIEIQRQGGWAQVTVETADGDLLSGWVYAKYLRRVSSD